MITLPANFTGDIITSASAFFANFAPYITLIIGILLATVVVEIIIGAIKK